MQRTREQISFNMRRVKNKGSLLEQKLRKALWPVCPYYRLNVNRVFGKPDIAYLGEKIAVFCDSEFWHGYNWDVAKNQLKSNREFWIRKIERNQQRDKEVTEHLKKSGWVVLRFWEKDINNNLSQCIREIERVWRSRKHLTR